MSRLVVVSNRVAIPDTKGAAGGLAVALKDAFNAYPGLWFGWSGRVASQPSLKPRIIEKGRVQYALMDLTPIDREEYYSGFANRALWPTMHYRIGLADFSRADYAGYIRVNRSFASALKGLIRPDDLIWVHDYHLIPLASELRSLGIANRIGYFHHIPWPAPEVLAALPGSDTLLRTIMSYDLAGVHTERDADNLRRGLVHELGAVPENGKLALDGRQTVVRGFPIGIDLAGFQSAAQRAQNHPLVRQTMAGLGSRQLIIGVDRLDYSKGIPERMESFERFMISNPDQRGRVTYLQIAPTSRSEVPEYATLSRAVNDTLGRINGSLGEPGWVPIHYMTSTYPRTVLAGLYRLAKVGLVTPIRDGMNLVAKEYVAAQDPADPGVLILSKFAGAAEQLKDALLVNPNDKFEVAEAIQSALHMDVEERIQRWTRMMDLLKQQDVSWWATSYLDALSEGVPPPGTLTAPEPSKRVSRRAS